MPRRSRLEIVGSPQLVLRSCIDRRSLFRGEEDFGVYLEGLWASSADYACRVHAFALVPGEVCLLVTGTASGSVTRMMQSLGRRYAHYANRRDRVTGSLWNGRYQSCPVGGGGHVLRAMCFVDHSPARVGVVKHPARYAWSSCAGHVGSGATSGIEPHAAYLTLGKRACDRCTRYRDLLAGAPADVAEILMHVRQGCAWGDARFLGKVRGLCGERGPARPRGRPRKRKTATLALAGATVSPFLLTSWFWLLQTLAPSV